MVPGPGSEHAGAMTTTPPEGPPQGTPTGSPADAPYPAAPGPTYDPGNAPSASGPRVSRDEVRDLGRLRRSIADRKVAGVAGGLARHLDIDPVIVRVLLVVLVFFGGAGLLLYGACWLLVPEDGSSSAPLHLDERSRSVALIVVGVLAALAAAGGSWGAFQFPWPLAIVALLVLLVLNRRDPASGRRASAPTTYPASYPASYPTPPADAPASGGTPYAAPTYAPAYAQPTYAQPTYAQPAYAQPAYVQPAPSRPSRRRGPILFWFTLALITLGIGVLGIFDLAGAPVADSAYPALAVGVTGAMLLVGAFYGRAGGLILLGLVSTMALAGATAADHWDGSSTTIERPASAALVAGGYTFSTGELVLDLRSVADVAALDGRTIELTGNIGHLEVILPPGIDTQVDARIQAMGSISLFGHESGGLDLTRHQFHGGVVSSGTEANPPILTLDANLDIGQIEVHQ